MPQVRYRKDSGLWSAAGQESMPPQGQPYQPRAMASPPHNRCIAPCRRPFYRPLAAAAADNDDTRCPDRAPARWTIFFLALTFASWLLGTLELMWYYGRLHGPRTDGLGGRHDDAGRSLAAVLVSEAVYFILGFVALCLAAFCLTVETCLGAVGGERSTWGKYSKEV